MKRLLGLHKYAALLLTLSFTSFAVSANNSQSPGVDVFGYYFIKAPVPKAFANIDHLNLATIDDKGNPAPLNGRIRLKNRVPARAVDFLLVNPKLEGKQLTFTTKTVGGVGYSFSGAFTKLGNFPETRPEGQVILKGHLVKLQNGAKVAESDVSFTYTGGD